MGVIIDGFVEYLLCCVDNVGYCGCFYMVGYGIWLFDDGVYCGNFGFYWFFVG